MKSAPDEMTPAVLESTITCPECGAASKETMPTDACIFFYHCASCGVRLKPKHGDCCVFCSYGSVPCPPIQGLRLTSSVGLSAPDEAPPHQSNAWQEGSEG
jgi:hypothetical protein